MLLLLGPLRGLAIEPSPIDIAGRTHEPLQLPSQPLGDRGDWYVLDIIESKSAAGATLTKLDDGSIHLSGHDPQRDSYTLTVRTSLKGITAMRLDTLVDDSLPGGGPGRARNGNFTLTEFTV